MHIRDYILTFCSLLAVMTACHSNKKSPASYFAVSAPMQIPTNKKADAYFSSMQFKEALKAYETALEQQQKSNDSLYTLQQMVFSAWKINDFKKGRELFKTVKHITSRTAHLPEALQADQYLLTGMLLEQDGKWRYAMDQYQQALPLYERSSGKGHWRYLHCETKIAGLYAERSAYVDSAAALLPYLSDALNEDPELQKRMSETYLANAWVCSSERNYEQGIHYSDLAIALIRQYDPEDLLLLTRCQFINSFLQLKKNEELSVDHMGVEKYQYLTEIRKNIARADHYYAREISALLYQFESLKIEAIPEIKRKSAAWQRLGEPAYAYWLIASSYELDPLFRDSAIYYYKKVMLRHYQDTLNTNWRLMDWVYWSLYELYDQKEEFQVARHFLFLDMAIGSNPDGQESPYNFVLWHNLAGLFKRRFDNKGGIADLYTAAKYYLKTDSLYYPSLPTFDENSVLRFHRQVGDHCYGDGVAVFHKLFQYDGNQEHLVNAYRFIERRKSYLLYKDILSKTSDIPEGKGLNMTGIRNKSRSLKAHLEYARLAIANKQHLPFAKSDSIENYQKTIVALDSSESVIKALYYRAIQQPLPDIVSLRKKITPNKQALIEYLITDDSCYVLYMDTKNLSLMAVCRQDSLLSYINQYKNQLTKPGSYQFIYPACWLYDHLIKPFDRQLAGISRILIIPDREMSQIPFESFVTIKDVRSYATLNANKGYAIHRFIFSYSPSVKLWFSHDDQIPFPGQIGLWLDDELKNKDVLLKEFDEAGLPYKIRSQGRAEIEYFKKHCTEYPILHLLMHGRSSVYDRKDNFLVFYHPGKDTVKLYGHEIQLLQLQRTQLVILTACETAVGESSTGEGAFTLSRSFQQAGAHNVVASLWKANEKCTIEIINLFYRHLSKNEGISIALHLAKLEYLNTPKKNTFEDHPAHWAVMIGLN